MWFKLLLFVITVGSINCKPFEATLSTLEQYEVGKDITCKIVITNTDVQDYYLLKRNTPLDKLSSHTFQISQNGNAVPYDGLLYQRIPPTQKEFIMIPAQSSITMSVDLSQFYSFNANSDYEITLKTLVTFYKRNISDAKSQDISSNKKYFSVFGDSLTNKLTEAEVLRRNVSSIKLLDSLVSVSKPQAYVTPAFAGSASSTDITTTLNVYKEVYRNLGLSIPSVDSNIALYTTFFGTRYVGYMNTVRGAYSDIKQAVETYRFVFYFDGPVCATDSGIIAYTYKRSSTIYFCSLYRTEPDIKGQDTKLGTVIHELSHAVAYTDDIVYGKSKCVALAATQPEYAIKNADNYHYFSEPLSQ